MPQPTALHRSPSILLAVAILTGGPAIAAPVAPKLLDHYCADCHDSGTEKGGLSLEGLDPANPGAKPQVWESVVRKLHHRQMPPLAEARPDNAEYEQAVKELVTALDRAAAEKPNPGRTDTFRRLNRTEYQNAIRDLLAVEIDATALLPNDEPSFGFDNVAVGNLSPTLLDRYVSAAQKIARLAVGTPRKAPGGDTFRVKPDVTQEEHVEGLPLGTRGGLLIPYTFPLDGEYEIQVRLARDRNEVVEGLRKPHEVEVLLDRERIAHFTVKPPADKNFDAVDQHLKLRLKVKAGPHDVGVTFLKDPTTLIETERQPYIARFNMHRHPRTVPAIYQVSITGPFEVAPASSRQEAVAGGTPALRTETPSRRILFGDVVAGSGTASHSVGAGSGSATMAEQRSTARTILGRLMRRAYRRPVTDDDLRKPMEFFEAGCAEGAGFESGIESALTAVLVSPRFLIRVEADPAGVAPGTAYRVSDFELASRLSFFLWSSVPDDALLDAAERGELRDAKKLEAQVRRMLADERARSLVTNFASQWLHLRKLDEVMPDGRRFIEFDDNLRQALRQETELFFEGILRDDRSILELLSADYTFLNERLAKHYGIPHVYGSHFRRVSFGTRSNGGPASARAADDAEAAPPQNAPRRGGLLRHGSVHTVTSYATRTSPVIRGKWVLDNILGTPPPPPAPDVPALEDGTVSAKLPVRERLLAHRANPACATCHDLIDPLGFALENFDAIGRWRATEEHKPIDASGSLPDGTRFDGVASLEQALLQRPELFAGAVTEKLLIFALGRGVEYYDAPAVRQVVRRAQADQYRFSSLILGIVNSTPFQMRKSP